MYLTKFTIGLRVSKDGELEGLDLHEHGGGAYPEQLGGIISASSGAGHEPAAAAVPAKAY
jgi:Amt family ammonium transporter